jgi:hypothetical protein
MLEVPGAAKPEGGAKPEGDGKVAGKGTEKDAEKKPKEIRDPSELVQKGIDPQLELAVLLLQGRALGMNDRSPAEPTTAPAQRPAAPGDAGKARS